MLKIDENQVAGAAVQTCPIAEDNWVDIEYQYADGSGVASVNYTLFNADTDETIAQGALDGDGNAHVEVSVDVKNVRVAFNDDPDVMQIKTTYLLPPNEHNYGWFERISNKLNDAWEATKDGASWTWELVQGDFNENPTVSQIITNAIITAIPVVDQVADVRDIIAALKQLVWDKRYTETVVWFALFVTIIGLVPTVGSLVKGIVKLIWKGAKLDDLLKMFNYFMKGNGIKWLKTFNDSGLSKYTNDAKKIAHDIFTVVSQKLKSLLDVVPDHLVSIKTSIGATLNTLQNVKSQINGQFDNVSKHINMMLAKIIQDGVGKFTGQVKTKIVVKQSAGDITQDMTADSIMKGANKFPDEANQTAQLLAKQGDEAAVAIGTLAHARNLIDELPDNIKKNYHVYESADGQIIVSRLDASIPPKLRYDGASLTPISDQVDVFAEIKQKLKLDIKDLSPKERLQLEGLSKDRAAAVKRRDAAILSGDNVAFKQAQQDMRGASERIGEAAGEMYVRKTYPDAETLQSGFFDGGKQGQFDQVYLDGDKVIIIEAKGGASTWGSRMAGAKRAQQGSEIYMESIVENYLDKIESGKLTSVQKRKLQRTVAAIQNAIEDETLEYIGVMQKVTDTSLTSSMDIVKFKIGGG